MFWTEPVIFFITKDPGITAATHWVSGDTTYVVAFDLLLLDISRFTTALPVSERGTAFVLAEREGGGGLEVVGLPRSDDYADDGSIRNSLIFTPPNAAVADSAAQLPPAENMRTPGVATAVAAWEAVGRPQDAFRFRAGGEGWWGGFHAYTLGENTFWIAVIVPEADFLGDVIRQRNVTLAVSLVALLSQGEPYRRFTPAALMDPNGFSGVNGIFRFNADGTSERGLAVLEVNAGGPVVVSPAPTTFLQPGF